MAKRSDVPPVYQYPAAQASNVLSAKEQDIVLFPGFQGIPIRGIAKSADVTKDVLKRLQTVWDVHFRMFNLRDEEDKAAYEKLMSSASTMRNHVRVFREEWPDGFGKEHWFAAVKWGERYWQDGSIKGVKISDGHPLEAEKVNRKNLESKSEKANGQ